MSHVGLTCSGCFTEEKKLVSKSAGTVTSVRQSQREFCCRHRL